MQKWPRMPHACHTGGPVHAARSRLPEAWICAVAALSWTAWTDHFAAGPQTCVSGPMSLLVLGLGWAHGPVCARERDGIERFAPVFTCLPHVASVIPEGSPSKHLQGTCGRVSSVAGTFADRAACPVKLPHAPSPHHGTAPLGPPWNGVNSGKIHPGSPWNCFPEH